MAAIHTSVTYECLEERGGEHATLGCKCCRFTTGRDLPIPKELTVAETKRAARHFSISVFKDWTQLNATVKRYEAIIQKRWMKKSVKQRREVLVKAWPAMSSVSATHRPDFENLRATHKQAPRSRTCRSEAFLWPYINLEDLQQRNLLLLFINSRGRNLPDTFRIADVKAAHLGDGWDHRMHPPGDSFERYCCEEHYAEDHDDDDVCLLFQDTHSPTRYGRVVTGHTQCLEPEQFKFLRRQGEGLLSLEIQQGIYRFLLAAVKLILHDIPLEVRCFLAPSHPEPAMLGTPGPDVYLSLSIHSLEAPYRVPHRLDLERLRHLVDGRRASAEDHIWSLREDPAYFFDSLQEWHEHGPAQAAKHQCTCTDCWNCAAGAMITNVFEVYVFWDDIYRKLKAMPDIDVQMKRADGERVRLWAKDEDRWAALTDVVRHLIYASIAHLVDGIPVSPRLRSRYMFYDREGVDQWVLKRSASEAERRIDALWYAITHGDQRDLHGLPGLAQEFQYMLETDAQAAQHIDPWIASHFADIALCSEIIAAIDSLAPWFDENQAAVVIHRRSSEKQNDSIRSLQTQLHMGIKTTAVDGLDFEPTKKGQFDYPIDKRRTKSNVDQMCFAEKNLDSFWRSMEEGVCLFTITSLEKVLKNRMGHPRELYRSMPWEEPQQLPTPAASSRDTEKQPRRVLTELDGNIPSAPPNSPLAKKNLSKANAKDKVKTRGQPAAQGPPDLTIAVPPARPAAPVTGPVEKVKIPKRAYKVFTTLLPSHTAAQQPRPEIPWNELLYAMNAIGIQPIKLYGSVWMFRPVPKGESHGSKDGVVTVGKLDMERSIQFHEPKEVRRGQKIPRPMVRMFGRRLKHAFGWEDAEELFKCEE